VARLMDRIAARLGYTPARRPRARGFDLAGQGRLFADWVVSATSGDTALRGGIRTMRERARDLALNEPYARKFFHMLKTNVVGPQGIRLRMAVRQPDGSSDAGANKAIEEEWARWGRAETCSVCGTLSWIEIQALALESVARDGEVLIRLVRNFDNGFGFALQLIEADHLDEQLNQRLPGGREIRMGVELDAWRRPVAYHLLTGHPAEAALDAAQRRHTRVPAADIIHLFVRERVSQTRGVPWIIAAATRLKMIGGYEEAALVAARVGAAKMGFFTQEHPDDYGSPGDQDEAGNPITDADPGHMEKLPPGVGFEPFDPGYPTGEFAPFLKSLLRAVASGLNTSYNSLASDLEGVNFSSIRAGVQDERDGWRAIQTWYAAKLHDRVFREWLPLAMLAGALRLPIAKLDKFQAAAWQPRGWAWVDPQKDAIANNLAIANGVRTRRDVLAAEGKDFEDTARQLAEEERIAASLGLTLAPAAKSQDPGGSSNG